jgi:hypothetical protein
MGRRSEDYRHGGPNLPGLAWQSDARAAYHAAVAEFDRLWETGKAKQFAERMRQLLTVIDAFEQHFGREID